MPNFRKQNPMGLPQSDRVVYVQGPEGPAGLTGKEGPEGPDGAQGVPGPRGWSGLQGPPGEPGPQGAPGQDGADGAQGAAGLSAYDIALIQGFAGTEAQWLASLVGPRGEKGDTGATGAPGPQGAPGTNGTNGVDGQDGADGVGVPMPLGSNGQVLSIVDHEAMWADPTPGGVWGGITGELLDQADLITLFDTHTARRWAWDATHTYALGEPCSYMGMLMVSLQSDNLGHSPSTSHEWWGPVSPMVGRPPSGLGDLFISASAVSNYGQWIPADAFLGPVVEGMLGSMFDGVVSSYTETRQYHEGEFVAYNGALWLCSGDPPDVGYTPPGDGSFNNEYWWKPQMFSPSAGLPGQVLTKTGDEWSYYDWRAPATAYTPNAAFTFSAGQITGYNPTAGGVHVRVPPMIGNAVVTSTGVDAFAGYGLVSLELPDTITSIGQGLAYSNNGLRHLKLPNNPELTSLPAYVANNANLASVEIPDSVTSISSAAFNSATKIIGRPGSYAEGWCKNNNRTFIDNGKTPLGASRAKVLEEDFYNSVALSGLTGAALSSGTASMLPGSANHPGIVAIYDSTTANGGYTFRTSFSSLLLAGGERCEFVFQSKGSRATAGFRMGWEDSFAIQTQPTDAVCFEVANQSTQVLRGMCKNNAGPTYTGTTYTLTKNTWYRGVIELNQAATTATFTLYSEAGAQLWQSTVSANIPNAGGRELGFGLVAGETTTDATALIMWIDYMRMEINRPLTR